MRVIKFRVWNKKEKILLNPYTLRKLVEDVFKCGEANCNFKEVDFDSSLVVMQFTGLKDKNGKEIYEGDVVTWFADGIDKRAIVKWIFNGYVAERIDKELNKFEKFFDFQSFIPVIKDKFDGEVIGNIYENPKLLDSYVEENETEGKK